MSRIKIPNVIEQMDTADRIKATVESLAQLPESRRAHCLKTWPEYLDAIGEGRKTFELRKDDRRFRVGDILHLREWNTKTRDWGDRSVTCFVTYILRDYPGISPDYCIMGIRLPANHQWPPAGF